MAQPPAVVIIARHGTRFDAAHSAWHLSTPTPYDPPLTYAGWNHCRALGVRIASLLYAREQAYNNSSTPQVGQHGINGTTAPHGRRRRKKHKVVIHSSPFLRCLQTSVAIAAGMAQFEAPREPAPRPVSSRSRTAGHLTSVSPRLKGLDGPTSPSLAPISEPKHDFAHDLARRALEKRHRKAKVRVDAFLGEWLNPSYFEDITPPPPSAMMVATAKARLMQHENVDLFVPTVSNKSSSGSSLWSAASSRGGSRENTLDDWTDVTNAVPTASSRRDRTGSMSSVGSNDSSSGRRSPFRSSSHLQPLTSTIPKPEASVYHPPTPAYAVSGSEYIPRGYVAHARNACTNVDYQWDSSRSPLDWGDGGQYGEEWSSMQRRFRRGLGNLIHWYSQHDADDRAEDALGFDQAERHHEDEDQEDLVVIFVTHGAGCNALIGALTAQPVLLDVGMASLTMAVRRDDAPSLDTHPLRIGSPSPMPMAPGLYRRVSETTETGLSEIYEMKLVSSSEHLRPGSDPRKTSGSLIPSGSHHARPELSRRPASGVNAKSSNSSEPSRNNTNTSLGSIRRPTVAQTGSVNSAPVTRVASPGVLNRKGIDSSFGDHLGLPSPTFTTGLWTPPSSRLTPQLGAQTAMEEKDPLFSRLSDAFPHPSPGGDMVLDFSNTPPDSRPSGSDHSKDVSSSASVDGSTEQKKQDSVLDDEGEADNVADLQQVSEQPPQSLSRGLSQKGLWGRSHTGDKVARKMLREPKRRWTLIDDQPHD